MTSPSIQLADLICNALVDENVIDSVSLAQLKQQILSGKTKPEDWYSSIEKNMDTVVKGVVNGN